MSVDISKDDLSKIVVIGDRLLIQPTTPKNNTNTGLILPPGVSEKESIQSGYVIKVGPGYPIPNMDTEEPWKPQSDSIKYIPLQIEVGDLAIYLQSAAFEISFNKEKYFILSQSSVLMVVRDEDFIS